MSSPKNVEVVQESIVDRSHDAENSAGAIGKGKTLSEDLRSEGFYTHGLISADSNDTMGRVQAVRDQAGAVLHEAVSYLSTQMKIAAARYSNHDKGSGEHLGTQMQT